MTSFFVSTKIVSAEASNACYQVMKLFETAIYETGLGAVSVPGFDSINCYLGVRHPYFGGDEAARARVSKAHASINVDVFADYRQFAADWAARVSSVEAALLEGIGKLPPKHVDAAARGHFAALVVAAAASLKKSPPRNPKAVTPVYVLLDPDGHVATVGTSDFENAIEITVTDIDKYVRAPKRPTSDTEPFTLYRMDSDTGWRFVSVWHHENSLHELTGTSGRRGDLKEHADISQHDAARLHASLKREAKAAGFKALSMRHMKALTVFYDANPAEGSRSAAWRHEIEDAWNNLLGWYGLGFCDGGASGLGTHDIHIFVVDRPAALQAIEVFEDFNLVRGFSSIEAI